MKYFFPVLLFLGLLSFIQAEDIEADFLQSLDEVSEIATKTKLNIDDTPSFVTVLRYEKLKKLGISDFFEALCLIPGVQVQKEITGVPVIVFRGVTQKSEVKLMIDGVTINNSYRGSIYYYLDFPIELIDRIEIIRGAGSVLYGSNAISGVINIITKSSQDTAKNKLCLVTGSNKNNKTGTIITTNIDNTKISADAYLHRTDKIITVKNNPSSQAGESDRRLDDYSVGINISNKNLSFMGRIKKSKMGNAYGIFGILDTSSQKYYNENRSIISQIAYKQRLASKNDLKVSIGYTNYRQIVQTAHPLADITSDYEEQNYFGEISVLSKSIQNNRLLAGIRAEISDERKNDWKLNGIPSNNLIVDSGFYRRTISAYLNDEYSINEKANISAGIRYDYFSDFQNSFSPNLGFIYKFNDKTRLKAQYSHSFRAPSWVELTSNDNLKAEKSDSIEAGIVFKESLQNILRINFYATKIDDMITKDSTTRKYIQKTKNNFYGAEMEYSYTPNNNTELKLNASYVDAKNNDNNKLPNVANILASTSLTYETNSGFVFGSLLKYVSGSKRFETDTRKEFKESFIFNQTVSYSYKDFAASLVLNDLFDANTYYALPPNVYAKDFDDGGRSLVLNISLEF